MILTVWQAVLSAGKVMLPTKLVRGLVGGMTLDVLDALVVEVKGELEADTCDVDAAPFKLAIEGSK